MPSKKVYAINLLKQQEHEAIGAAATQYQHYCSAILPAVASSGQLDSTEVLKSRPICFLFDNVRHYVAKIICQKLLKLEWEALIHLSYSPDLMLPDWSLFLALGNVLWQKVFSNEGHLNQWREVFFVSDIKTLYFGGIEILSERKAENEWWWSWLLFTEYS